MAHMKKQLFTRSPLDGCRPANNVRTGPEEDKDLAVSLGSGLEAAVYAPSVGTSRTQRGGGRSDAVYCRSTGLGEVSACRPIFGPARQDLLREIGLEGLLTTAKKRAYSLEFRRGALFSADGCAPPP